MNTITLNLTKDFEAKSIVRINSYFDYETFDFAGGEPHFVLGDAYTRNSRNEHIKVDILNFDVVNIIVRINSPRDLMILQLAVDVLKRRLFNTYINVIIPYFPAARQDRVTEPNAPFSLKVYADVINAMGLDSVTVFDPHSDVTPAVVSNCIPISNYYFIDKVLTDLERDYKNGITLISPDAGASKKVMSLAKELSKTHKINVVKADKLRIVETGEIESFEVYGDLNHGVYLVVDDICDGGGTFAGLAKAILEKQNVKLFLAVSHGIFSKGFSQLGTYYHSIYTTDSIKDWSRLKFNPEFLKTIKL